MLEIYQKIWSLTPKLIFRILFGSFAVHLVNIGLLVYRRHLIRSEPPAPTIQLQEDPDGAIFLY